MYYLFSNVIRPSSEDSYKDSLLDKIDVCSSLNTMVFFNSCSPIFVAKDIFEKSNVVLVNRLDSIHGGAAQGGDRWNESICFRFRRVNIIHVDDHGQFYDASYRKKFKLELDGYPLESPTSGFMMWRMLCDMGKDVSTVNFYGPFDSSTPMYDGHDYSYENRILRNCANMIFLED